MSTSIHYKSNLRDLNFNLFEVSRIQDTILGRGDTMDESSAKDALVTLEKFAREQLANSFVETDRIPLTLDDDGNVTLPPALRRSLDAWYRDEWHRFELPTRLDGYGAPPSVIWASFELQSGANPTLAFYTFGTMIAKVIDALGTEDQKRRYVKRMIDSAWGGCMVLTEPDAGSDVGAGRAKARHIGGDVWELEGTKRFITNGDFDGAENIVHLVLARPEGHPPGTPGLSMFIVPKYWVEEDGSLGARNGAFVTGLEKKMGLKGSATAELTLGDRMPCRGLLVGNVHNGIKQMFNLIEHARMAVGVKSMSTLSTAYLNALEYAKERVQGPELPRAADKNAPRVRIIEHADVRRTLLELKAHAEGLRALAFHTAHVQDRIQLAHGTPEAQELDRENDLLLPLVKGFSSHRAFPLLADALQVFGGSGYVQDYPMEQYVRDQKIDSLYEGTTHIQALDLIFRKIMRDQGATLRRVLGAFQKTAEAASSHPEVGSDAQAVLRSLADMNGLFGALLAKVGAPGAIPGVQHIGVQANRLLVALAETVVGGLLLRHALVAAEARPNANERDREFYTGKLASLRTWTSTVLPNVTLARKLVEASSLFPLEVPEGAF